MWLYLEKDFDTKVAYELSKKHIRIEEILGTASETDDDTRHSIVILLTAEANTSTKCKETGLTHISQIEIIEKSVQLNNLLEEIKQISKK